MGEVVDVPGQEIWPGKIVMVEIGPIPFLLGAEERPVRAVVRCLRQYTERAGARARAAQTHIGDEIMVEALERERAVIGRGQGGGAVGAPPVAVEPALELADERGPPGDRV